MSKTFDIGISTAYGAAVRGGYAGTYEQFCADLARLADVLEEFLGFSVTIQTLAEGQQATASYENGVLSLGIPKGDTGNGIQSISLLSTVGQVKTYRITYTNGNHFDFPVADGKGISNTTLNADYTLTITYTDGTTWTSGSIRGQVGATPHLTIGTVETLPPSQSASATITGTDENPVLNLGIPKGNTGEVSQAEFDALSGDVTDLSRQISDVENALINSSQITGTEKTGYWRNRVFTENAGTYTKEFDVSGLSTVTLTEFATPYRDAYVFLDSANTVIDSAVGGADPGTDGYTIVLPVPDEAVFLDSSVNNSSNLSKVKLETPTPKVSIDDIDSLQSQIDSLGGLDFAVLNGNNANVFYRRTTLRTGYTIPYSRKFKVVPGRKYKITLTTGSDYNAYTFIDENGTVLSYEIATSAESKEYIVDAPIAASMLYCSTNSSTITSIVVYQQISETDTINAIAKNEYLASIIHNVICIGDSLTQGYRNETLHNIEAYSYPMFLSRMANWEVVNAGWAGITPIGWWDKRTLYTYADKQFAIIKLGQNGGLTDTLAEDTSASSYEDYANTNTGAYCKIIEYIKEQNPHIVIFIVSVRAYRDSVTNDVLRQIADKYNLPFIDLNDARFDLEATDIHTISDVYDAVHFNTLGYTQLATSIYELIVLHLADNKNLVMDYGEW